MTRTRWTLCALLVVALTGCDDADPPISSPPTTEPAATAPEASPPPASPIPEATHVDVQVTTVAAGLDVPWDVAFLAGGRALVSERDTGVVRLLDASGSSTEVRRLPVNPAGEGGLLGLAVPADAGGSPQVYAYYTSDRDNRVVRFPLDEDTPPEEILTGIPSAGNHNGGRIAFGPDGMLYVATGDAGRRTEAQDPTALAGKILRLTPDGDPPGDNPTPGSPVYALGLRNVQGLAWDADGRLYATEFGPDADDEINRIEPGGNYGWPQVTGTADSGFLDPLIVRQPPEAAWSGAAILDGGAIPQWEGSLFAAGLRGQRLWRFTLAGGQITEAEELLVGEHGRLRHVLQAPDGSLWVLTSNRDGRGNPGADDDRILRLGPP